MDFRRLQKSRVCISGTCSDLKQTDKIEARESPGDFALMTI